MRLTVRANRIPTWRGQYRFKNFDLVVSGTVVDAQNNPIEGLPVCRLAAKRASYDLFCNGVSRSDGRFTVRLRPVSDVNVLWEVPQLGDSLRDIPWRTAWLDVADLPGMVITMQQRGVVTGGLTGPAGKPLSGREVCAAPRRLPRGAFMWLPGHLANLAWCAVTDANGEYSLRVDGGEQIFLPGDPTSSGFVERMDTYLAADDSEMLKLWDVGWSHPDGGNGGDSYRDMIAEPGRRVDVALTDLVPGANIRLSGVVTRAPVPETTGGALDGIEVCAFSRSGFFCVETDATGRYDLSLPTRVSPGAPTEPVTVKIVASPGFWWAPAVDRFTATPGTTLTRDLQQAAY